MYKQYSLILPILIMIPFLRFDISDFLLIGVCTVLALKRKICLLYTSDAADDLLCVDLGGRRIIKKKKTST